MIRPDPRIIATVVQAPDEGGDGDTWADLLARLPMSDDMRAACAARREFGIQKHGRPLALHGGTRDADVDLAQELLDAAAYAWRRGRRALAKRLLAELYSVLNTWDRP